jgi:hypothetical protein
MKVVTYWPTRPEPDRMLDRLSADVEETAVGFRAATAIAIPDAGGRLLGVTVRPDGSARLLPPVGEPVELPPGSAALLGLVLSNGPKGGEE